MLTCNPTHQIKTALAWHNDVGDDKAPLSCVNLFAGLGHGLAIDRHISDLFQHNADKAAQLFFIVHNQYMMLGAWTI